MVTAGERFFDVLFEFFADAPGMTDDELRQALIDEGVDVDALTERVRAIVERNKRPRGVV